MFSAFEVDDRKCLDQAFAKLCPKDATADERDELRLLLLELADGDVTDVEALVARARAVLEG